MIRKEPSRKLRLLSVQIRLVKPGFMPPPPLFPLIRGFYYEKFRRIIRERDFVQLQNYTACSPLLGPLCISIPNYTLVVHTHTYIHTYFWNLFFSVYMSVCSSREITVIFVPRKSFRFGTSCSLEIWCRREKSTGFNSVLIAVRPSVQLSVRSRFRNSNRDLDNGRVVFMCVCICEELPKCHWTLWYFKSHPMPFVFD